MPEELPSSRFTWDKYISKLGICLTDVYSIMDPDAGLRPGVKLLGWCRASSLVVRPRTAGYAIMVEFNDTGEETWCHCGEERLEILKKK